MEKWIRILNALNERTSLSDRKLGPLFGLGEGAVGMWRTGRGFPDEAKAHRIAELLDLDPAYVVAVIGAARAKSKETRAMWQRIAEQFKDAAVIAALAIGAASFGASTPAEAGGLHISNTHCRRKPRWWES